MPVDLRRCSRLFVLVLLGGLAAGAGAQPAADRGESAACPWELMHAPNPGGSLILFGADATARDNMWAVGTRTVFEPGDTPRYNYAARWDGDSWVVTEPVQPSTLRDSQNLAGVLAMSPSDAIIVGTYNPPAGSSQSQSQRWNGSNWTLLNSPSYSGGTTFRSIGRAGDDIWAGGSKYSELPPPAASTFPMAARLNGNSWEVEFVPPLADTGGRSYNFIRAIGGATEDDVWGAGIAQEIAGDDPFGPAAMMVHWDGSSWSQYDLFPILSSTAFSSVEGLLVFSSDNVWAAGFDYDLPNQRTLPLVLHWDGSSWSNVPIPDIGMTAELRAIHGRSPDDIYAVGTKAHSDGQPHGLMLHYDGVGWTEVAVDSIGDHNQWYRAITLAGDEMWAMGQSNSFLSDGFAQRQQPCDDACLPDLTNDNELTFADVLEFLNLFTAGDMTADFAPDGVLNFFDVAAFLEAFGDGCP